MQPVTKPSTSRILSAGAVRVSRDRAPVGALVDDACGQSPRVETRQRDGVVREILITCGCGQQTVLECDYNELAGAKPPKS